MCGGDGDTYMDSDNDDDNEEAEPIVTSKSPSPPQHQKLTKPSLQTSPSTISLKRIQPAKPLPPLKRQKTDDQ